MYIYVAIAIITSCDSHSIHYYRHAFIDSCREFKSIIQNTRESAMKGLGFSKTLMTDLEIAAEFIITCNRGQLLQSLAASDHSQVIVH